MAVTERDHRVRDLASYVEQYEGQTGEYGSALEQTELWIRQFEKSSREDILGALNRTLKKAFIHRTESWSYFATRIRTPAFWNDAYVLDSSTSESGRELSFAILETIGEMDWGADALGDMNEGRFMLAENHVVLDDVIHTGGNVIETVEDWWAHWPTDESIRHDQDDFCKGNPLARPIEQPDGVEIREHPLRLLRVYEDFHQACHARRQEFPVKLHIWTFIRYRSGEDHIRSWLADFGAQHGFAYEVHFHSARVYEDRHAFAELSDVLWPSRSTAERLGLLQEDSVAQAKLRGAQQGVKVPSGRVFLNERDRDILEYELLHAGAEIIGRAQNKEMWEPLGLGRPPFGFGSLAVSHRLCSTRVPLALWWSLQDWIPLFPRMSDGASESLGQPSC